MANGKTELEKSVLFAEGCGQEWVEVHTIWMQLDEGKKSYLASLMNDLDDGKTSEKKLERIALGCKEFREYVKNMCLAKGVELRAKVRYDNARDLFEAGRSKESTEREKIKYLSQTP